MNNSQGMQTQMVIHICGAERGTFKSDDGKDIAWGSVYGGQNLTNENAVGFKAEKYKADATVFDSVKNVQLPAAFLCNVTIRASVGGGQSIRVMTAQPFNADHSMAPQAKK